MVGADPNHSPTFVLRRPDVAGRGRWVGRSRKERMDVRGSRWARLSSCAILLLCLAGATTAFAQGLQTATLSGTVVDNVGVVPGATVTATNAATGAVRSA